MAPSRGNFLVLISTYNTASHISGALLDGWPASIDYIMPRIIESRTWTRRYTWSILVFLMSWCMALEL